MPFLPIPPETPFFRFYQKQVLLQLSRLGPSTIYELANVIPKASPKDSVLFLGPDGWKTVDRALKPLVKRGSVLELDRHYTISKSSKFCLSYKGYLESIMLGSMSIGQNAIYLEDEFLLKGNRYFIKSFQVLWNADQKSARELLPVFLSDQGRKWLRALQDNYLDSEILALKQILAIQKLPSLKD